MNDDTKSSDSTPGDRQLRRATNSIMVQSFSRDKLIPVDEAIEMISKRLPNSTDSKDNIEKVIFFRCIFTGALSLFWIISGNNNVLNCDSVNCREEYERYLNNRKVSSEQFSEYYLLGILDPNYTYTILKQDDFEKYGEFELKRNFWKFDLKIKEHNDLLSIIKSNDTFSVSSKCVDIKSNSEPIKEYSLKFIFLYNSNMQFVYCYDKNSEIKYFLIDKNFECVVKKIFKNDDKFYKYIESCFLSYLLFVDGIFITNKYYNNVHKKYKILYKYRDGYESINKKIHYLLNEFRFNYVINKNEIENLNIEEQLDNLSRSICSFYPHTFKDENSDKDDDIINEREKLNHVGKRVEHLEKVFDSWDKADPKIFKDEYDLKLKNTVIQIYVKRNIQSYRKDIICKEWKGYPVRYANGTVRCKDKCSYKELHNCAKAITDAIDKFANNKDLMPLTNPQKNPRPSKKKQKSE